VSLGCHYEDAEYSADIVSNQLNTGLTVTNMNEMISFVCISKGTSRSQIASTIVHEVKHVQSHICSYYGVSESGEQAAYLVGYIAKNIYKFLSKLKLI
jgi:hypothetical protein